MNHGKKTIMTGVTLIVVLTLIAGVGPALAVDNLGLFELDGNAVQDACAPPDDWETLYNGGGSSIVFTGIIADPNQETIFVGGRKDIQDVNKWGWKNSGGFPDKDDITNAYGAAYLDNGDLIAYFGADRFANNGDAYMGFWFFQDQVSLNPDGSFNGEHEVGDLLVLVNFPQATNKSPEISVVEWNPAEDDVAKNLKLVFSAAVCSGGGGSACAITNDVDSSSPWPYTPKSGTSGTFPFESLFEGGINLTELLGWTPCFGSFMAETRSSEKFTATLKDFVLAEFPVCEISVSKACDVLRLTDGNDLTDKFFVVSFDGNVTNTGAGTFPADATLTVVDDAGTPGDVSDDVVIQEILGSPIEPNESVPFSGEFFTNSNPPHNTVTASIAFAGTSVDADPFSIDCNNLVLNPSLSLSKNCWAELVTIESLLAVEVLFTGEVCNTGDVPLTVTVTDDKVGLVLAATLMDPGNCITIDDSYLPSQADGDVNNPCDVWFSDTLTAVGTSPVPGVEDQNEVITANCPLCDCD
jgi:hypothetical protein